MQNSLVGGADVGGAVGFARHADVAGLAEPHCGWFVRRIVRSSRVISAVHVEDLRCRCYARARGTGGATRHSTMGGAGLENVLNVLVVASGAGNIRVARDAAAVANRAAERRQTVSPREIVVGRAGNGRNLDARVVRAAEGDGQLVESRSNNFAQVGHRADRVIVIVVAYGSAVVAEQGWDWLLAVQHNFGYWIRVQRATAAGING